MMNLEAWYHGIYVGEAIGSCFSKECQYPNKPLDLTANKSTNNPTANGSVPSVSEIENKSIRFSAWADVFNENFIKEHPETNKPDAAKDINNQEGQ
jgi:hypothetical protein